MSSVQEKTFLRLIKFSYDLSLKVTKTFTKTNILHNYNNSFVKFLEAYKHELYHLWNNTTRCCACSSNLLLQQYRELNREQFTKLFDIKGNTSPGHFIKGAGKCVIQHCLCGVTCIPSCSLNDLDIILIHTIIRKCVKLSPDDDMWLQTIREVRNNLAHAVSTTYFDQGRLQKWWTKLEGSVLGLAGKIPPMDSYAELVEDQIKLLSKTDLDKTDVEEIISLITEERKMQEEITEAVKQNTKDMKEMLMDFKNLMFKVKTDGLQHQVLGAVDKYSKSSQQDSGTLYVEWRLQTPDDWQVEFMKEKLQHFKSLFQGCFKLEFVYVGSLVIQTSVPRGVTAYKNLLVIAIRSFLETMVGVCKIDTETTANVHIDLSIIKHICKDKLDILPHIPKIAYTLTEEEISEDLNLGETVEQTNITQEDQSVIEHIIKQRELEDRELEGVLCGLCQITNEEVSVDSWCLDCNVKLCIKCRVNHKKDHHTVNVNSDLHHELESQLYCIEHDQLKVEYYCPLHDCICCHACLDDKHKSCGEVLNLDEAFKDTSTLIFDDLGVEIDNISKSLVYLQEEIHTNISDIRTDSKNVESNIVEVKAKAIAQINENEKLLLSELQEELRKAVMKQDKVKEKCQGISEILVVRFNEMKFIKDHGTEKQAFILTHHLKSTLEKIYDSVSAIISSTTRTQLQFDERKDLIPSIPTLGVIQKSEHTPEKQVSAQCAVPQSNKPLTSFELMSSFKTLDSVNINGMIVTEDNKLLLCNYYREKCEVLVYNDNGRYFSTINLKHRPYDIAVIPGYDQYVVTLAYMSSIQFINGKDLTPGSCVKLPIGYFTHGIAADKQYIYAGSNNKIFVLNHEGCVLREIKLKGCGHVFYLTVIDNNLYASDMGEHIYCVEAMYKTIPRVRVTGAGLIRKLIVDRQGYMYIGGGRSGKVHRLDKNMKQDMTISDKSVKNIQAICFNKNCSKLFVADGKGEKISVFRCS